MPEPIHSQVVDDDDEPGGERTVGIDPGGTTTQAVVLFLAERLAHSREDVHDLVRFGGIVAGPPREEEGGGRPGKKPPRVRGTPPPPGETRIPPRAPRA